MALSKLVMKRGTYFKGYQLTVNASTGDYVLHIDRTDPFYVCSVQMIADDSGPGDYITIEHADTTASGYAVIRTLGDTLYNPGPGANLSLVFPAIEPFNANEDLRITYTNVGTTSLSLNVYVEFIR